MELFNGKKPDLRLVRGSLHLATDSYWFMSSGQVLNVTVYLDGVVEAKICTFPEATREVRSLLLNQLEKPVEDRWRVQQVGQTWNAEWMKLDYPEIITH